MAGHSYSHGHSSSSANSSSRKHHSKGSSRHGKSADSSSKKDEEAGYNYEWVWACHNCGGCGGMSTFIDHCPDCSHTRCENCAMEMPRSFIGQFKQFAFVWKSEFSQRHDGLYDREEDAGRVVEPRLIGLPQQPPPSRREIVDRFVDKGCEQEPKRYFYRSHLVSKFLSAADFDILTTAAVANVTKSTALIDDRNDARGTRNNIPGEHRTSAGGLDPRQLYIELLKPRIALTGEPDAERRLIYVTDLDPSGGLALVATVSPRQAIFVRDFMYRYLACRTLMGVEIPSTGFPTFSLEFHLPYYAWRQMPSITGNELFEREIDGKPFRITEEVIRLKLKGQAATAIEYAEEEDDDEQASIPRDYICQGQISVMLTGIDDWFWTAYCFVDTYFKEDRPGGHSESIQFYSNQMRPMDPIGCGEILANLPAWNPRHYFLRTLSARMEQVRQEWSNAVFQLLQQTEPCIYSFTRGETDLNDPTELDITQQPGFKWTIRVLRQFTHMLSKTIDCWDNFKDGEIRYFTLPDSEALAQAHWGQYLAAIDKNVTELRDLRKSLMHQTELFENMTNSIVTHAAHAETIITRLQSQFIQALTVITIFYLPPTLASTVFSMQSSILPSDTQFTHWVYVLIGLFVITVLLVINVPHITNFIQLFRGWQDKTLDKVNRVLWVKTGLQERWRSHELDITEDEIELPVRNQGEDRGQDQGTRNGEV